MGVFDTLLKQVIANDAAAFASWILQAEVDAIEPVSVELLDEAIRADAVFRGGEPTAWSASPHLSLGSPATVYLER